MSMDYNSFLPGNMSDENQILQNPRPSKARKRDGFSPGMYLGATTMVNWPKQHVQSYLEELPQLKESYLNS